MDPISSNDRLVALLRQRLSERDKTRAGRGRTGRQSTAEAPTGIKAIAALDAADDRQRRRACVQALLAHELGQELINDARFQQIVTRVTDSLVADEAGSRLLDRVIGELRAS